MNFTTKDLQTILYSLEGYVQGNDDNELVEDLEGICYRIQRQIEVQGVNNEDDDYASKVDTLVDKMRTNV
tara:strand:+ start:192 stop:401 length:210 start_codon:yes stop_codon:yes gene_type:complete